MYKYKKIIFLVLVLLCFFAAAVKSAGEEAEETEKASDYGQEEIMDALPDDVRGMLEAEEITPDNGGALGFSASDIFKYILDVFGGEASRPLTMLASLAGIILLSAVIEAMRDSTGDSQTVRIFGIVSVLAGAGMVCYHLSECIVRVSGILTAGGTFLVTFIPVFAGIMAISGQVTTAPVFNSVIIIAAQLFSHLMTVVLIPVSSCILGVSVAGAADPELRIERLAETVKKAVVWVLGLLVAVFVGMLSIQGFITASADTVAMKAAKFAVSSSVPFIGGAVSDALSTVKGSVSMLKNSTGTFGIVAGIALLFPVTANALLYRFALTAAAALSDIFGADRLSSLLKSGESIMGMIIAMLFCFVLLSVVSVALMLYLGLGGAAA